MIKPTAVGFGKGCGMGLDGKRKPKCDTRPTERMFDLGDRDAVAIQPTLDVGHRFGQIVADAVNFDRMCHGQGTFRRVRDDLAGLRSSKTPAGGSGTNSACAVSQWSRLLRSGLPSCSHKA